MNNKTSNTAFTLIEVLIVIVIISIMGSMVMTAVSGVMTTAKQSRTKTIISIVDSVLAEHYANLKYRQLPVEIPDLFQPSGNANELGFEVLASEAARVRLMMIRDLQRMEIPDRLSDITTAPSAMYAATNKVLIDNSGNIINTRDDRNQRKILDVTWYSPNATFLSGSDNVPSRLAAYRNRMPIGLTLNSSAALANQGAECLYLIMATSFVGGTPALEAIPSANIGDTDKDGLREILDGWGNPLGFIRWPVGYFDPELSIDKTIPDDFDLFRSDYSYTAVPGSTSSSAGAYDVFTAANFDDGTVKPWSMRPLVFSGGPDGEYGITANPITGTGVEMANYNYQASNWWWPTTVAFYGQELPSRDGLATRPFPDPYLRMFVSSNLNNGVFAGRLPGQLFATSTSANEVTDNITNYQLQVSPR
ncbi:MAG: prepilin-type N-terminal cleavage/methylation domain-containing protein [Rubripirellula sp.]|nr:prepilin-type N-terminal cleavage/methylation domain-containing protein [Rubripirellula sp.]